MPNLLLCLLAAFVISVFNTGLISSYPDLWPYFKNSENTTVNKTKLFHLASKFYITPPICLNTSLANLEPSFHIGYDPPCICSKKCYPKDLCCLDHPYKAVTYSCFNVVVYPYNARFKLEYPIVTTCELRGVSYAERCNMNMDTTLTTNDPIVTSVKSGLSYKNKYCASCHMEQEEDLISWELRLYCRQDIIKMAMTSKDIMSLMKSNIKNENCVIAYYPEELNYIVSRCMYSEIHSQIQSIKMCNASGLWISYDADTAWGCAHFDLPYRGFKNVFCYICNPSIVSLRDDHTIDKCNTTGLWKTFDLDIFENCQLSSTEPLWRPFKNLFCCLCNSYDANVHWSMYHIMPLYSNTEGLLSEWYDIGMKQFITVIKFFARNTNQGSSLETAQNPSVNYFLNRSVCAVENQDTNQSNHECSYFPCSFECPVETSCCNRYVAQKRHFVCIYDELHFGPKPSSEKAFVAIGSCLRKTDSNILEKCEHPDTNDILQVLPETAFDEIVFRNVYCGQCNGIFQSKPFDLTVQCDIYVDAALLTTLQEFIKIALEEHCSLKYLPRDNCDETRNYITKCNTTGFWQVGSKTIQRACESDVKSQMSSLGISVLPLTDIYFERYTNIYCFVCNPTDDIPLYYKCNVTGQWTMYNSSVEMLCLTVDRDLIWGPFKNMYCLMCNTPGEIATDLFGLDNILDFIFQPSYRSIFRISPNFFEIYNEKESTTQSTGGDMTFEKILCAEGKLFLNNSCDYPVDAVYNQIEYGMYFCTELRGHSSNKSFNSSIKIEEIISILWQIMSKELDKFDSVLMTWNFHLWTSFPCSSLLLAEETILYAFVSMQIRKDRGSFKHLEEHFTKEIKQTILFKDTELTLKLVPDYTMLYLFQKSVNLSETGCYLHNGPFDDNVKFTVRTKTSGF
ncbi:hypothetical protein CHS0354_031701 [Potamilus streckersoni]|uniref:Uncharacterized protein n=1 Tax=Potamilus streckersoni TaxID=2493646 RepID=A0AAE0VZY6_9BIVA|nr:hypothetical protein CHS0354_031701 [Potamilus streckersoni]